MSLLGDFLLGPTALTIMSQAIKQKAPMGIVAPDMEGTTLTGIDDQGNAIQTFDFLLPTPLPAGSEVAVAVVESQPSGKPMQKFTLNDGPPNFDTIYEFADVPNVDFPAGFDKTSANNSNNIVINNIMGDANGKTAMQAVPDKAKAAIDPAEITAAYAQANNLQKKEIEDQLKNVDANLDQEMKGIVNKTSKKQDGSRTSREHHEWKYCCVLSNNFSLLNPGGWTYDLVYVGPDPLPTKVGVDPSSSAVPPYYKWIEYEALRKVLNAVKRSRRLRTQCNAKKLWEAEGLANKEQAIRTSLEGDTEFTTNHAILVATADFTT